MRVEGIVEPVRLNIIYAAVDGFVEDFLPSGTDVSPDGPPLIKAINPVLNAKEKELLAERRRLEAQRQIAQTREIAEVQILEKQLAALNEQIKRTKDELASLNLHPSFSGTWIAPDIELSKGLYLYRGHKIGYLASLNDVLIRATAGQSAAAILIEHAYKDVQIRVKGRPDMALAGRIEKIIPAGHERLPSAALGYAVGGSMPTISKKPDEIRTAEKFFEVQISPDPNSSVHLLSGQRIIARFQMPSKPLAFQWWRGLRQLFQRRFRI
jgi:putative peptide zinc metalloprotease protein